VGVSGSSVFVKTTKNLTMLETGHCPAFWVLHEGEDTLAWGIRVFTSCMWIAVVAVDMPVVITSRSMFSESVP
jgi:hypothetical protein